MFVRPSCGIFVFSRNSAFGNAEFQKTVSAERTLNEASAVLGSGEFFLPFFQILPEISVSDGTGRGVWGEREGFPPRGVEGGTCPPFKKTFFKALLTVFYDDFERQNWFNYREKHTVRKAFYLLYCNITEPSV